MMREKWETEESSYMHVNEMHDVCMFVIFTLTSCQDLIKDRLFFQPLCAAVQAITPRCCSPLTPQHDQPS